MNAVGTGILFILGVSIFSGMLGAWFSQKLKVPQVVGYIAIGLVIGKSGLGLVGDQEIAALAPFNMVALGIIGFLVGGELELAAFRKYSRHYATVLLGEGAGVFLLVGVPAALLLYWVSHSAPLAAAAGLIFGAIAVATDSSSTLDTLAEQRCLGPLSSSLPAIVAFDTALAMALYCLGLAAASPLIVGDGSVWMKLGGVALQLFGAAALGSLGGLVLLGLAKWGGAPEKVLALVLGLILLLVGVVAVCRMNIVLASLSLGFVAANLPARRDRKLFNGVRGFSTPIYVLFFVLVGARLDLLRLPGWLWLVIAVCALGRCVGKLGGVAWATAASGANPAQRRYLGMGLLTQGGVAVGLSLLAGRQLESVVVADGLSLGDVIIYCVAIVTLFSQASGMPLLRLALRKAGECGRNITEEDVVAGLKVRDVMNSDVAPVLENMPVSELIDLFSERDFIIYPVVDGQGCIIGTVSLNGIKHVLNDKDSWNWLVASDIMDTGVSGVSPVMPLGEALDKMKSLRFEQIPVLSELDKRRPLGMLDIGVVRKRVQKEILRGQQAARAV